MERPDFIDRRRNPWRLPAYAAAIVVADALTWQGADATVLDAVAHIRDFEQFLVRALIFRLVADRIIRAGAPGAGDPFASPVELACALTAGRRR